MTKIEKNFIDLSKAVHSGNLTPGQVHEATVLFVKDNLMKGVFDGFGKNFETVDYNTPDYGMLAHLERNVYFFSTAKNYHEVVEMNEALRDGSRLRSFEEFKVEAAKIHEKFNATYLRAEYNHAVASGQMARRWTEIQDAKSTHPLLRYDTVGDSRVRLTHQELEGITKPIDDSFWDTYYPPNGWNCRCDVQQLSDGKITDSAKIAHPEEMPEMFKINTAKLGMVYPPKHPYWALPDVHVNDVVTFAETLWKDKSEAYKRIATFKNGGYVDVHSMAHEDDLKYNIKEATWWAKNAGSRNRILPHSDKLKVTNAELICNGVLSDFKETKTAGTVKSIKGLVKKAAHQLTGAVHIKLTHADLTVDIVSEGLRKFFIDKQIKHGIEQVWLRKGNKWCVLAAEDITEWKHKAAIKKLFK